MLIWPNIHETLFPFSLRSFYWLDLITFLSWYPTFNNLQRILKKGIKLFWTIIWLKREAGKLGENQKWIPFVKIQELPLGATGRCFKKTPWEESIWQKNTSLNSFSLYHHHLIKKNNFFFGKLYGKEL